MSDPLAGYAIVHEQAVAWGDLDANAHVGNVTYFRYQENARVAYYRRIGKYEVEAETGITLLVAETRCRYRKPVGFPDTVRTGATVTEIGPHFADMHYRVVSVGLGAVAAEGASRIVAYDVAAKTKAPFPDVLRRRIEAIEAAVR